MPSISTKADIGAIVYLNPTTLLFATATPASEGRQLLIGDTSSGSILHTLPAHGPENIIRRFSFSRDGRTLLSGGDDKQIRAWDTATGTQKWASPGGIGEARFFTLSPDLKTVFTADFDTDLRFFNAANGELTRKVTDLSLTQFVGGYSPDSKWLAFGGADRQIHLWDVPAAKLARSIPAGPHLVGVLLFSPDSRQIAYTPNRKLIEIIPHS